MVGWEEAYIGEQSIIRPPAAKNAAMTAAHSSLSLASLPTLKVIQLPSPTAGSLSPVDGIGLVMGSCARAWPGSTAPAAVATTPCTTARRVVFMRRNIGSPDDFSSPPAQSARQELSPGVQARSPYSNRPAAWASMV